MQNVVFNTLLCSNCIPPFVASRLASFLVQKLIDNTRIRVLDALNHILFSETVNNKFITMQNVVFNTLLCCNSISQFVS